MHARNCRNCKAYSFCGIRKFLNVDEETGCKHFAYDDKENKTNHVNNTLNGWDPITWPRDLPRQINGLNTNDQVCSGEDFKKMADIIHKNAQEDFEFDGYKIFVNDKVGKCLEGLKDTMEAKEQTIIRSITVNEKEKIIAVVFRDGGVEVIRCREEDDFDVNIGVALAIAQHLYGSKTRFHKEVVKRTRKPKASKKEKKNNGKKGQNVSRAKKGSKKSV